jgi:hypothetical protein
VWRRWGAEPSSQESPSVFQNDGPHAHKAKKSCNHKSSRSPLPLTDDARGSAWPGGGPGDTGRQSRGHGHLSAGLHKAVALLPLWGPTIPAALHSLTPGSVEDRREVVLGRAQLSAVDRSLPVSPELFAPMINY